MPQTRLLASGVIAAAICTLGLGAPGAAASQHLPVNVSFPDTLCGFSGVTTLAGIDNFGSRAGGGTYDNGRLVQTFTATNGRGVEIDYGAGHSAYSPVTPNGDGTFTQVLTASGLDVLTKAVNGPVLEHGAGRVQITFILDPQGDVLSASAVALSGHQPNLTGAPDCGVIAPYLGAAL